VTVEDEGTTASEPLSPVDASFEAGAGHGPPPPTIHGFLDGLKIVFQSGKVRVADGLAKLNDFGRCFPGSCHPPPAPDAAATPQPGSGRFSATTDRGGLGRRYHAGAGCRHEGRLRCTGVARR